MVWWWWVTSKLISRNLLSINKIETAPDEILLEAIFTLFKLNRLVLTLYLKNSNVLKYVIYKAKKVKYLGTLSSGDGRIPISWGMEYKKLNIWGIKKIKMVSQKCPKIPTITNTVPAEVQKASPTKTFAGYLKDFRLNFWLETTEIKSLKKLKVLLILQTKT